MATVISNPEPHIHHFYAHTHTKPLPLISPKTANFTTKTKLRSRYSIAAPKLRYGCFCSRSSAANGKSLVANVARDGVGSDVEFVETLKRWAISIGSVLPGGSWWNLYDSEEEESGSMVEKPITVLGALRRIWVLVANDSWVIYLSFGSLAITALSEISIPNLLTASIFSAQSGETAVFYRNSQLLVLLCFTSGICSGLRSGFFGIANMILLKRLRETLYTALILQDISFFDKESVGNLTSRLGADCQRLSRVIGTDIHLILRNVLQGIGALSNLLSLSSPLALSSIAICSVLSAIFMVYSRYQKKAAKFTQESTACANDVAQETLSLVRTVRVYGTETIELGRYKHWLDKLAFVSVRESVAYGFWNMSFNTMYRSTQVFAILLGGTSVLTGHVSPEELTKYVLYCEWLIYAAWRVQDSMSSLLQSVGASEKVFQLMNFLPSDQFLSKGVKLQNLTGHVEFVDVCFSYPSRITVPILERVSMSLGANQVVAIVGLSGSGKSTLVNLLLRLYEPTNGQILIDGFPLRELDIRWLREKIGFVGQEPQLFHMDVKSNISYGCSRDIKQKDVEWAAKQAQAHEFISSLPNGYRTIVDNDSLSGGQKQRIAIARAILRDPAILILDEATSALDAENEFQITEVLRAFRNDVKTRTVIVIAHRLSTIKAADRIVVMDGGRIVEMGDHGELLCKNGLYSRLVNIKTDALA